jgi:tetratricopeptide (TPR) repeat protein
MFDDGVEDLLHDVRVDQVTFGFHYFVEEHYRRRGTHAGSLQDTLHCYAGRFKEKHMDWLEQARALAAEGEMGKAIDVLERAVAIGEETSEICKELAKLCLTVNEVRAFANYCHEAIRLNPDDGEPYLMIARVLTGGGRWGEAAESLEQALARQVLDAGQRAEAEGLLATARVHHEEWKRQNPGFSNLNV